MNRKHSELDLHVLEILERNPQGLGSPRLLLSLLDLGIEVSQPTIARLLALLDHRGLTRKVTHRGRALTPAGAAWLEQARHHRQRARWVERLILAVQPSTLEELRDVLVARRALEQEIARLAAEHATPLQIAQMQRTLELQKQEMDATGESNDAALEFHRLLAGACGNTFLGLAADVLRSERHVLEVIMYHLGSTVGGDSYSAHVEILDAVATRDRDAAAQAMVRHLTQYIRYVDSLPAKARHVRLASSPRPSTSSGHRRSIPVLSVKQR